jgi:hypothetical protein
MSHPPPTKRRTETMAKVKQLEWIEYEENWFAAGIPELRFGYEVRETQRGGVRMRMPMENFEAFNGTLEEAKAAAQADFERRIRSVIE